MNRLLNWIKRLEFNGVWIRIDIKESWLNRSKHRGKLTPCTLHYRLLRDSLNFLRIVW